MKTSSLVLAATFFFFSVTGALAEPKKMRFSHQLPDSHFLSGVIKDFKQQVEEKSNGNLLVEIYPAAQAFKPKEVVGAVITGAIEAGMTTNMEWGGMLPAMDVFNVPFLLTEMPVIEKAISGEVGAKLSTLMQAKGVVPIMFLLQCRTNIYTSNGKAPILPEDFKGKKMRGTGKVMNLSSEAMGAATVSISGPEVYQALQLGTLDIGLTGPDAALARHYDEVQKFGTISDNMSVFHVVFANKGFIDSLAPEQKKTLTEVAMATQKKALEKSEEERNRSIKELSGKMTVHIQSKEEAELWKGVMVKPVTDYFLEKTGKDGEELVKAIENIKKS